MDTQPTRFNFRLFLVYTMAVAVSFPTGVISTAKALLMVGGMLVVLLEMRAQSKQKPVALHHWSSLVILVGLGAMALSLLWTSAPLDEASVAWAKHAKLAMVPLIVLLLRSREEALRALKYFLGMQAAILILSWLSWFHVPLPFPTQTSPGRDFLVFAGHLDQPIMMSTATAIFWHLRTELGSAGKRMGWVVFAVVAAQLLNILGVQFGRTGQLVAIALLCLSVFWLIPRRFKVLAVLSPVVVAGAVFALSPKVQHRMDLVWTETSSYETTGNIASSSGERLNYWRRSLQAIAQRPLLGYGVGSWNLEYNRMEGGKGRFHTYQIRNPHEEFLLWTVELGLLGLLAIGAVFVAFARDAQNMPTAAKCATLSVLIALLISCSVNSSIFDAQIGDFLCVAMALCLAYGLRARDEAARIACVGQA